MTMKTDSELRPVAVLAPVFLVPGGELKINVSVF